MSGRPSRKSAEISLFRPFSAFFALLPEGLKSTWKIQKTEEKGLFPQISSDFLKPPSLKPPFAAPQQKSFFRKSLAGPPVPEVQKVLKSGGRGCLEEGRLGVPGQVWEFRFLPSFPSFPRENCSSRDVCKNDKVRFGNHFVCNSNLRT